MSQRVQPERAQHAAHLVGAAHQQPHLDPAPVLALAPPVDLDPPLPLHALHQLLGATAAAGLGYSGHSSGAVFFDFDRDGRLDLFVCNIGRYTTEERGPGGYFIGLKDGFYGHLFPDRSEQSLLYRNLGGNKFLDVSKEMGLQHRHEWRNADAAGDEHDGVSAAGI